MKFLVIVSNDVVIASGSGILVVEASNAGEAAEVVARKNPAYVKGAVVTVVRPDLVIEADGRAYA